MGVRVNGHVGDWVRAALTVRMGRWRGHWRVRRVVAEPGGGAGVDLLYPAGTVSG
jgi:hypothetical protein